MLNTSTTTRFNNDILYGNAIWRKLSSNQRNSFVSKNETAERLQVQSTSIDDFELDLFNKHAPYVGDYTDTLVKKRL